MNILELNEVCKNYGSFKALDHISYNIPEQSIFGMLGPNGAGKTTTIRIITGIFMNDGGELKFSNEGLAAHHTSLIGYMPEERGLYKKMKVWEQLVYLAQLKGLSKPDAKKKVFYWLEKLNIKDWWNKKVEELSKGMQQKIQFIATVVHEPKLIILDEPFSGLDPINTNLIKDEISELRKKGSTIIFSTHRMEQVEEICEEIVLYNKGKIILNGKVNEIRRRFKQNEFAVQYEGALPDLETTRMEIKNTNDGAMVVKGTDGMKPNDLLRELMNLQIQVTGFNEILPSLNEIFISQVENNSHE